MKDINKRRRTINLGDDLFNDMVKNHYDIWLKMLYDMKLIIIHMESVSQGVIGINCISPYFDEDSDYDENECDDYDDMIKYQLVINGTWSICMINWDTEHFEYSLIRSCDEQTVFHGKIN